MKPYCCILLIVSFVTCGCDDYRPDELERKSFLLTNGLSKAAVSNIFSGFPAETNEKNGFVPPDITKRFQTNQISGSYIMYLPKEEHAPLWIEWCQIWFDTNGIIIGYWYVIGN